MAQTYPNSSVAPRALLAAAEAYEAASNPRLATKVLLRVVRRFPDRPADQQSAVFERAGDRPMVESTTSATTESLDTRSLQTVCAHNARLQPPAARNARIEHDARIEGAPTVGCEPWLCDPRQ